MDVAAARRTNAVLVLTLLAVLLYALFPGRFDADSAFMYAQSADLKTVTDHHSPLLVLLLSATRAYMPGPTLPFLLQVAAWTLGLFLFSDAVIASGRRYAGLAVTLVCASPLVSFIFVDVNKDTMMAAVGMVLVALVARRLLLARGSGALGHGLFLVLALVFVGLRHNAFITLVPLLAAFLGGGGVLGRRETVRLGLATAGVLVALVAADHWVKYDVLKADRAYGARSLAIFDIAGVTRYSGQDASSGLLGPSFLPRASACYRPKFQDPFEWGDCSDYGAKFAVMVHTPQGREAIEAAWLKAVTTHPLSYLHHRLAYYNQLTRTWCTKCIDHMTAGVTWVRPWRPGVVDRISPLGVAWQRTAVLSYKSLLGRGVFWLVVLAACLAALAKALRKRPATPLERLALAIALAALLHGLALFWIGVAYPLRYLHWMIMLAGVAVPLTVSARASGAPAPRAEEPALAAAAGAGAG